jgi:hypothetical protein
VLLTTTPRRSASLTTASNLIERLEWILLTTYTPKDKGSVHLKIEDSTIEMFELSVISSISRNKNLTNTLHNGQPRSRLTHQDSGFQHRSLPDRVRWLRCFLQGLLIQG